MCFLDCIKPSLLFYVVIKIKIDGGQLMDGNRLQTLTRIRVFKLSFKLFTKYYLINPKA